MRTSFPAPAAAILTSSEGWFGRAPRDFQRALLAAAEPATRARGESVYHASDAHIDLYAVVDGCVETYARGGAGDNPLLHLLHEGAWIGMGAVVSGGRASLTVVARTPLALARVPRGALLQLLEARPAWWRQLALGVLEYADVAAAALADLTIRDKRRRCATTLLRLAGLRPPRRARPELACAFITQDEIAPLLQISRTTLVPLLTAFERDGLIEQGYRVIHVRDAARLQALATS
jgi:CRP-like cAMP-binding protein